jgi:hypothetical protein
MLWRCKTRREQPARKKRSAGQYWARTPSPTDGLVGYVPDLGLVDENKPGEIYPR